MHLHPRPVSPHGPRHAVLVHTADRRPPAEAAIPIVAPLPGVMGGVCLVRKAPGEIEEKCLVRLERSAGEIEEKCLVRLERNTGEIEEKCLVRLERSAGEIEEKYR